MFMQAQWIYFTDKGVAEIREVDVGDPKADEIQVKCIANGICMGEVSLFTGMETHRFPLPLVPGHEGIGRVTRIGSEVTEVKEGDYVVCRQWATLMNVKAGGAVRFAKRPADPSIAVAEPVDCVVGALYSFEIMPGDRVLLMGAGFMGLLNVQGLRACPIAELVVTDVKQPNLDLAAEFGATKVINTALAEGREELDSYRERKFDLVIEAAGVEPTLKLAGQLTRVGGRIGLFAWHHTPRPLDLGEWHMGGYKVLNASPMISTDRAVSTMERAVRLIECGTFDLSKLITHRHHYTRVQEAMELAVDRRAGYIKGVLLFDE
ncbi:MAG: zinc-binding dehydrogenase [Chitinivibrionales bacterium]|nr:zinc-binding dehydrogenase [Chitinivibrionales bacterium]